MARSLVAGSLFALIGAAMFVGCSSDPDPSETTSSGGTGSTSSGAGGTGGVGGQGGEVTASSSSTSSGGAGGEAAGGGGPGGTGTGGVGGAGGGAAGAGGAGGTGGGTTGVGGAGGSPLPIMDEDKDGWTIEDGDCCDSVNSGNCENPELVNPGAFEYLGNQVDDDCDQSTLDDVVPEPCSKKEENALVTPTSSGELVEAMDLCQYTFENVALPDKKWGVISTGLYLADGSANSPPKDVQVGVLSNFGPNVVPKKGTTMAALSTGTARDEEDINHVYPQNGNTAGQVGNYNASTGVSAPPAYLAGNNGALPSPANCPVCSGANCTKAFDSVSLKARIRVPTNARSFSYNFKFYSAEFPEFTCQQYNDFFVTLLTSSWTPNPNAMPPEKPLPADKNIAFDAQKNPVSVNNAFFEVCFPPPGALAGTCPGGTLELIGTGMGGWGGNVKDGGGTAWLTNDAPVVPGETIEIEFIIWDAGDHNVDSVVLLDKFRWNITPSQVGVHK